MHGVCIGARVVTYDNVGCQGFARIMSTRREHVTWFAGGADGGGGARGGDRRARLQSAGDRGRERR